MLAGIPWCVFVAWLGGTAVYLINAFFYCGFYLQASEGVAPFQASRNGEKEEINDICVDEGEGR